MKQGLWFLFGITSLVVTSCQTQQTEQIKSIMKVNDHHSFSEPWKARVDHLDLKLDVDFDNHILSGSATYLITTYNGEKELILDTDELTIEKVEANGEEISYELGEKDEIKGRPLKISLPEGAEKVSIYYHTDPGAKAVQWLSPEQTAQKEAPFLFTQSGYIGQNLDSLSGQSGNSLYIQCRNYGSTRLHGFNER